ncbi:MAG: hypothetical protein WC812_00270 [Candidatus Pacearchaeota archaeon]|jgi:hypothetical protein
MTKKYFLSLNEITKEIYLDKGVFDRNRTSLGNPKNLESFVKSLKKGLDLHRSFEIYASSNFSEDYQNALRELTGKTQVKVYFKKDLRQV